MARLILPSLVGVLLGFVQTGLFLQLAFTLSSSITTYLTITLCWLIGSVIGVLFMTRLGWTLTQHLILTMAAYALCGITLASQPFETRLLPIYAVAIIVIGVYPGVFFERLKPRYSARSLFFLENNGFIVGVVVSTLAFMFFGQAILWIVPTDVGLDKCSRVYLNRHRSLANATPSTIPT